MGDTRKKLFAPTLENALTCLDDKLWPATSQAVERGNRCARKRRSVRVLRWIGGVKPKPQAVNKPSHHFIMHELAKPGVFTTVSSDVEFFRLPRI